MSRDLPARPNLEHLKKQAKELLLSLQQQNSESRLTDAQHQIAREYGFESWPRLKVHVAREAAAPPSPFAGTWTADLSRSKLHPLNHLQSASIGFEVAGDAVTIDCVMVDSSGRTDRAVTSLVADNDEHPAPGRHGYVMRARWLGPRALEAIVSKGGEVEGRVEYVVAPDGRTLTLSATWRDGPAQVSIFARDRSA